MYATWVMLNMGPGMREKVEKMVTQFAALHEAQKGFISQTFLGDEEAGKYACLAVWESKKAVDDEMAAITPQLQKAITGIVKEEPTIQIFEVYEPKK